MIIGQLEKINFSHICLLNLYLKVFVCLKYALNSPCLKINTISNIKTHYWSLCKYVSLTGTPWYRQTMNSMLRTSTWESVTDCPDLNHGVRTMILWCDLYNQRTVCCNSQCVWFRSSFFLNRTKFTLVIEFLSISGKVTPSPALTEKLELDGWDGTAEKK